VPSPGAGEAATADRDHVADLRDQGADQRERRADEREHLPDERERVQDARERRFGEATGHSMTDGLDPFVRARAVLRRLEAKLARDDATLDREDVRVDRDQQPSTARARRPRGASRGRSTGPATSPARNQTKPFEVRDRPEPPALAASGHLWDTKFA
jgi:hypothetical protein